MTVDEIVSHYCDHGYVIAEGLLDRQEVDRLRALTDAVEARAAEVDGENAMFDFDTDLAGRRTIQRIKKPNRIDPFYAALSAHPKILAVMERLIGPSIRLNHTKINMKAANGGAALEWHQDWAFAPHTAMTTAVASVLIDGAHRANGAMQVIPGSHLGPLLEHHDGDGFFVGAANPAEFDAASAVLLEGPPGTVTFHHPLTIHGSNVNHSGEPRRILFYEYAASDAFPLFYKVDWEEYESRIVAGSPTSAVAFEANVVKLPFPTRAGSSIYKIQKDARIRYFADAP